MSNGATMIGTSAIRANSARKIPFLSILRSVGTSEEGESITSRFFTREEPNETRMSGIATCPADSSATYNELCRKLDLLKKRSSCSGEINATMTEARTAHNGGFIMLMI